MALITDLIDPCPQEKIYDPCCGTGGFLVQALQHIRNYTKFKRRNICLFGREISGTATIAKMNMIIMGDNHSDISQIDSLKNAINNEFDVVLTNFPFSQKTKYGDCYGLSTHDANPVFLKHVLISYQHN